MNNSDLAVSYKKSCPKCEYFQRESGVCKKFHFNVRDYPSKFMKKCDGNYFKEDTTKVVQEIDEIKTATELDNDAETVQTRYLRREDYWPFVVGVCIGGLSTFPFLFIRFFSLPIDQAFIASVFMSGILVYAHKRNGEFSFGRLIVGMAAVLVFTARGGDPLFVAPGALTILLGEIYGRIAAWLARKLGISARPDPSISQEQKTYAFGDDEYQELLERTYKAWISGESLIIIDPDLTKEWTQEIGRDGLEKHFKPQKAGIQYAFTHSRLDEDEYVLAAQTANFRVNGTCVLLTNKYLYLFDGGPDSLGKTALEEITDCKVTKKRFLSETQVIYGPGRSLKTNAIGTNIAEMLEMKCDPSLREFTHQERMEKNDEYQFLHRSYESWRSGSFDQLGDYFKSTATKSPLGFLTKGLWDDQSCQEFLKKCFKVRVPEADEFFVTIAPESFMLTNKCLYIYTSTKREELHTIHLCEILSYECKGLWMSKGTITLSSAKVIQFKIDEVPDKKYVRQLQKMLDCDHPIDA